MRKGFLISLVSLAFAAGVASAQEPPILPDKFKQQEPPKHKTVEPGPGPLVETEVAKPIVGQPFVGQPMVCQGDCVMLDCCPQDCGRCWGSLEYLLWWITDGPIPGPLVTTGNPADGPLAGTLGQPDTIVLFGNSPLDYGRASGARLTFGGWLNCERTHGVEVSGFFLQRRNVRFDLTSNNNGFPPTYVPAFNVPEGREDSLIVADPLQRFGGTVSWKSTTQLWGMELNGVFSACRSCNCDVTFLAGVRYLDLAETLRLRNITNDLENDVTDAFVDRFDTRNQFYGAQIGARAGWRQCGWTADLTGKLALGGTRQVVNINGEITEFGSDAPTPGTFPGGFFTQPSNISRQTRCDFAMVPELELKVGYDICECVRAYVGYDVLYYAQVVRPGNQIDRNLNLNQSPIFGEGQVVQASQPRALFNESDFWAHGVIFGLEVRY